MELSAGAEEAHGSVTENLAGPLPSGAVELRICALSGMAAGPYCTGLVREWVRNENIPPACAWHSAAGLFYPPEYRSWLAERFRSGSARQEGAGRVRTPVSGSVYYLDPSVPPEAQALRVETSGFSSDAMLYVDGTLMGSLNHAGVFALPLSRGRHTVTVEDSAGALAITEFEVR
jgi:penicillin-binding protein 1C